MEAGGLERKWARNKNGIFVVLENMNFVLTDLF